MKTLFDDEVKRGMRLYRATYRLMLATNKHERKAFGRDAFKRAFRDMYFSVGFTYAIGGVAA